MAKKTEQNDGPSERARYSVRLICVDANPKSLRAGARFCVDVSLHALSDTTAGQIAANRERIRMFGGSLVIIWDVALYGQDLEPWEGSAERSRELP